MILTKTPLRISFFGGGSDIPQFHQRHLGKTISTTIDKYIYIAANMCEAEHVKVMYSELEHVKSASEVRHDRVREILKYFYLYSNIEICSFSDVNTKGTGLGSSSTFTVGVLAAVMTLLGKSFTRREIADIACEIEIEKCGQPIGKQDQYAAAYGGFNTITYDNELVEVAETKTSQPILDQLNERLYIFNTGISRSASDILSKQVDSLNRSNNTFDTTRKMVQLTHVASRALEQGDLNGFGELLDESWQLKKTLAEGISNPEIDEMYDFGKRCGAIGGKLLGAGGGGYIMFYMPPKSSPNWLVTDLNARGYKYLPFKFTDSGVTVENRSWKE